MPGKGKKGKKNAGKKKAENAVEEVTLDDFQAQFKKECKAINVSSTASQPILDIFGSYLEDEEKGTLSQLCVASQTDANAVEALFHSLQKSQYKKLKCICFWRSDIGDGGAKATVIARALFALCKGILI